jgi:aminomethyltransferase
VAIPAKTASRLASSSFTLAPSLTLGQISIPPNHTTAVAQMLSKSPVSLTGLGARDSLRLEAGLCLYGQDLDENTSPVEAGLTWVIGKERREKGGFIGAEAVQKHIVEGPPRRRIGLVVEGVPARRMNIHPHDRNAR